MKRFNAAVAILMAAMPVAARADEVVPLPSAGDDMSAFENSAADASADDAFGTTVSAAAKKLKDETVEQRKAHGKWVSGQRRKDGDHRAEASGGSSGQGKGLQNVPAQATGRPTSPGSGRRPSN